MNFILRLFLTFSAVSFFVIVFLVQNDLTDQRSKLGNFYWVFYFAYILVPFILALFALVFCKLLSVSTLQKVTSIETSNNDFLANYLAFFFVALSVKGGAVFWLIFVMTVLFTFYSRVSYFNPVFLIFGFNFYYVHTDENVKVMVISRKRLKSPASFEAMNVKRINDYTFIEI